MTSLESLQNIRNYHDETVIDNYCTYVENDFEEELRYRISRAQNEPICDEDWFVMCAIKELVERARIAVAAENK